MFAMPIYRNSDERNGRLTRATTGAGEQSAPLQGNMDTEADQHRAASALH